MKLKELQYAPFRAKHIFHTWRKQYGPKAFIQRGIRGYADSDTWSLDHYLCGWLPKALTDLKERQIGHPADLTEEVWSEALDAMIEGFKAGQALNDSDYIKIGPEGPEVDTNEEARLRATFDEGMRMFSEHFLSLWD